MTVGDVMQKSVQTCALDADLASAAAVMHERECGFLPVVDGRGLVRGVLTDRDIALAAATTRRGMHRISAGERMSRPVYSCGAAEDVRTALERFATHHIRRMPVLTAQGHLDGVISVDDIVAAPYERGGPIAEDIVSVLKRIMARPVVAAAAGE